MMGRSGCGLCGFVIVMIWVCCWWYWCGGELVFIFNLVKRGIVILRFVCWSLL